MSSSSQPDHLTVLEQAWRAYRPEPDEPLDSPFGMLALEIHLADALAEHFHSDESREAISQLFVCDQLSHMDLAAAPYRDDELVMKPLIVDVAKADVRTLLWFVERQTAGADPAPDMGGLPSGPATIEKFGLHSLRECAMRCLNALLANDKGREAVGRSPARDQMLGTAIGWCTGAFNPEMREYGVKFKRFAEMTR